MITISNTNSIDTPHDTCNIKFIVVKPGRVWEQDQYFAFIKHLHELIPNNKVFVNF